MCVSAWPVGLSCSLFLLSFALLLSTRLQLLSLCAYLPVSIFFSLCLPVCLCHCLCLSCFPVSLALSFLFYCLLFPIPSSCPTFSVALHSWHMLRCLPHNLPAVSSSSLLWSRVFCSHVSRSLFRSSSQRIFRILHVTHLQSALIPCSCLVFSILLSFLSHSSSWAHALLSSIQLTSTDSRSALAVPSSAVVSMAGSCPPTRALCVPSTCRVSAVLSSPFKGGRCTSSSNAL